ncbi:hypothetical protein EHI8A_070880 [Entamoeba histolytica HM-1:IMSS-B]|uniref:MIB/HERC2 domain-containing protein n=6 Tax=Entamoeba histolytica TaxID=5759 RepID=C4M602_ENTH1|nr:hypothetical protein, conserved [Entamoeba histolytica HM-1:IMSS]EMD47419.1 Mib/herc2 domain containing protein [Entamoeba histolytica KU27]EMH73390.1 hypothetical protein EHI8A_070880 [Entamoeba histolytica HM-1:IMSS-B]EMS13510.1 mib/herc2 domain protein [Entamoeba histolytica HM-3:IMSS]ENY60635.1 hypothetical protein EHI7A_064770 [Entamoeba histolytica HM-1:IMSS-A]BAN39513.1 hypothetical protein, conserved [Entamoeba histolytica]|eukprot:XP_653006.1 hypothetical protein, conserved [Entamoeba histolytica HM-1:IMSS]
MQGINVDVLVSQINSLTSILKEEQTKYENELQKYKECRKETINAINNWGNSPTKETSSPENVEMPPEEQYKMPLSWIILKRVVQGRDWHYGRTDKKEEKGVVFSVNKDGQITVRWDDGDKTHCNWGKDGNFDVTVISNALDMTPVEPSEQVHKPISWLIGRKVKRGTDWKWSDQDGGEGKTGLVLSSAGKGWINVKWESGKVNQYRWGEDDCHDVEVIF